jgi:hypothetical protein
MSDERDVTVETRETPVAPSWWHQGWCWLAVLEDAGDLADLDGAEAALHELATKLFEEYGPCCEPSCREDRADG